MQKSWAYLQKLLNNKKNLNAMHWNMNQKTIPRQVKIHFTENKRRGHLASSRENFATSNIIKDTFARFDNPFRGLQNTNKRIFLS